jgi:hypothetical protein
MTMQLIHSTTTAVFVTLTAVAVVGCATDSDGQAASDDSTSVEAARADLDALYKGDYRNAFEQKNPDLFLRHISDDFTGTLVDGTSASAEVLRQFFPLLIQSIDRVIDHNVTIEDVQIKDDRIEAVVTLTTVMDRRSPANVVYTEISVGTFLDKFVRDEDGVLKEVAGDQLRVSITGAPRP